MRIVMAAAPLLVAAAGANGANAGAFSEVRFGVLAHDPLIRQEDGVDLNAEFFFNSSTQGSWELRPSIGVTANLNGDTSQAYLALNYGGPISDSLFLEIAGGGAIHDGKLETADHTRKELGSRVLFHVGLSLGVMLTETNAGVEERNEGLEIGAMRLGLRL